MSMYGSKAGTAFGTDQGNIFNQKVPNFMSMYSTKPGTSLDKSKESSGSEYDKMSIEQLRKFLDPTKTGVSEPKVLEAARQARAEATALGLPKQEIERRVLVASVKAKKGLYTSSKTNIKDNTISGMISDIQDMRERSLGRQKNNINPYNQKKVNLSPLSGFNPNTSNFNINNDIGNPNYNVKPQSFSPKQRNSEKYQISPKVKSGGSIVNQLPPINSNNTPNISSGARTGDRIPSFSAICPSAMDTRIAILKIYGIT